MGNLPDLVIVPESLSLNASYVLGARRQRTRHKAAEELRLQAWLRSAVADSGRARQLVRRHRHSQHHWLGAEVESPVGFVAIPDSQEFEHAVFERSLFNFQELAVLPLAVNLS